MGSLSPHFLWPMGKGHEGCRYLGTPYTPHHPRPIPACSEREPAHETGRRWAVGMCVGCLWGVWTGEGAPGNPRYDSPSPCQKPRDFLRFLVTPHALTRIRAPHATGIPYACGKGWMVLSCRQPAGTGHGTFHSCQEPSPRTYVVY